LQTLLAADFSHKLPRGVGHRAQRCQAGELAVG
jgi:hypothetical protein